MADNTLRKYKKLSPREHIIQRPDTYVGSISPIETEEFLLSEDGKKMELLPIVYNPALLKLFDEIITNASDHSRNNLVKKIEIHTGPDFISVKNDGPSVHLEKHPDYGIHIPELIFGNFLSGTNFDDKQKRTVGGRNGYGAKLVAVFSKLFVIEIVRNNEKYRQEFQKGLSIIKPPKITSSKSKDYTKITYYPEFSHFNMSENDKQHLDLYKRRSYDIAACTPKETSVYYNGDLIGVKTFESYVSLFIQDAPKVFIDIGRWQVCFALNNDFDKFTQVSFVNGIYTKDGGTHISYVVSPVIKSIISKLSKNNDISIKESFVKDNIFLFVNCLIENPTFNSQTKQKMTLHPSKFGSTCEITKYVKSIIKLGIDKNVLAIANAKQAKNLEKSDGKKKKKVTGIDNLEDASHAGTKHSMKCTLFITEGLSAKTFFMAGMPKKERDFCGVFALKGKLLNVRNANNKKISDNNEICNLKTILGLQQKLKDIDEIKKNLRYGKIVILTDADTDGSHIKGLVVDFIGGYWGELLKTDFVNSLATPVVVCKKGNKVKKFYNLVEYENWKPNGKWKIKYYKGLGTSTKEEASECFDDFRNKLTCLSVKDKTDTDSLTLVFDKDKTDERKEWIINSTGKNIFLDSNLRDVKIKKFIDEEFVLFSIADNVRSLPNLMDGLKPSQRKVLYGVFLRNFTNEIKVDIIRGFISEKTAYHHGEMSLNGTIFGMNHDFVGSNNINLLEPRGQFGSRNHLGKDGSASRYVSTALNPITRYIFRKEDDPLLNYLTDDGVSIEPEYYQPIIPTMLVNGSIGIGTGFSVNVPLFNPIDICDNLLKMINNDPGLKPLIPWYRGFKGQIDVLESGSYLSSGVFEIVKRNMVHITEIPVNVSIDKYKKTLEKLLDEDKIESFANRTEYNDVDFEVVMSSNNLSKRQEAGTLKSFLCLENIIKKIHINCFDDDNKLITLHSAEEVMSNFFNVRKKLYVKRREYMLDKLKKDKMLVSAKIEFIKGIIDNSIKVFRIKKADIVVQLETKKFPKVEDNYDYLLNLKIHTFTYEKINILNDELKLLIETYNDMKKKSPTDLWVSDIEELKKQLINSKV